MTLGERLKTCRKEKGLSQEEVAFALNVSRQALSKWECNASMPELENIIALSNFLEVSTDYLLKGEAPANNFSANDSQKKPSDAFSLVLSTALVTIGLIVALAMANDGSMLFYWRFSSAALGIGIQIVGIGVFEVLYFCRNLSKKTGYLFFLINSFSLSLMPAIFVSGFVFSFMSIFLGGFQDFWSILILVALYLLFNLLVIFILFYFYKKAKSAL